MDTPLIIAVAQALLHFLWEGALIALALVVLLAGARTSRARYAAACAAMAAMPVAFVATVRVLLPSPSVATATSFASPLPAPAGAAVQWAHSVAPPLWSWAVPLWLAGVLIFYLRNAAGWLAARRLRREAVVTAAPEWQATLRQLSRRLAVTRAVSLLESGLAQVPVVIGFLRPVVLLPAGLLSGMPAAQIEALLLHELAHIRRHDYLVNLAQCLIEGLLFYHPAVWWVSRVVRAEREHCCDDLVLAAGSDARSYAAALIGLEERRAPEFAMAATRGALTERVRRILRVGEPAPSPAAPLTAAVAAVITVAAVLSGQQQPPSPPQPKSTIPLAPTPPFQAKRAQRGAQLRREPETPYRKWLEEDVAYIITADERNAFEKLTTDAEREHFIEQFWQRRPPAFQEEHYRRIAYANGNFGYGATPGWRSDRGRAYILYGPPATIDNVAVDPPSVIWRYSREQVQGGLQIRFTDARRDGSYRQAQLAPETGFRGQIVTLGPDRHVTMPNAFRMAIQANGDRLYTGPEDGPNVRVSADGKAAVYAPLVAGESASIQVVRVGHGGPMLAVLRESASGGEYRKSVQLIPGVYVLEVSSRKPDGSSQTRVVEFQVQSSPRR